MRDTIVKLVISVFLELKHDPDTAAMPEPTVETRLYGGAQGNLDSVGLVALIAGVEDRVFEALGKVVIIADERAMSQVRSPFRTVGTLAEYIESLLKETA